MFIDKLLKEPSLTHSESIVEQSEPMEPVEPVSVPNQETNPPEQNSSTEVTTANQMSVFF